MDPLLIYGAYGYTGELIVRLAKERGLKPVLAGRSNAKLEPLAERHGLAARVFGLDDPDQVDAGLGGMKAVLHCAGPFSQTAGAMAEGCLRMGVHYLDITGEIEVFELMASLGDRARAAGVMLLPGAGFDVVPSDCLAAQLKRRLPDANTLRLAFYGTGNPSHGTAATIVENLPKGGMIRRDGQLMRVPGAWRRRRIDFGAKQLDCMTIPWGDVSTAYYSTGIPNIEVYMAAPAALRMTAFASRMLGPLLGAGPVQRLLKGRIPQGGPSDSERARGYSLLWGEVENSAGARVEARLRTPEGYTLTADTSLLIAQKVLAGQAPPGFMTPSLAYGPDLILEAEGAELSA